ncbi:MAG: ATP-dependent DNA helicase RecG [Treponema sp.]|jgi:ATP-dependent DNA helicase RecG|nr:ATP-dependent DNA helicase RecG [Treponema sp.]
MFLRSLFTPINKIKKADSSIAKFARLGIHTAADLLMNYPRDWEDRRRIVPLSDYENNTVCSQVTVVAKEYIGFGKTRGLKVYIEDESTQKTGIVGILLFFNLAKRPWLEKQFFVDSIHMVYGTFKYKFGEIQSSSFEYGPAESRNFNKILPVYKLTATLSLSTVHNFVLSALEQFAEKIENELPDEIITRDSLLAKKIAIKEIHFPSSLEMLEKAKKTLIYEELFYLEVMVGKRAIERKRITARDQVSPSGEFTTLQKTLLGRLEFSLTEGQTNVIQEINKDMRINAPMARLLQGDVGSGKTLVSFMAALFAVEKNSQAAIMAPTELLARQHAENAARLLEPLGVRIAFLTGNIKALGRKELLKNLAVGTIDIVIGTHALFSKDVEYKNLTLVVIDEQHRFGVTQRSLIMTKGQNPDLLMMSATPIPRTLALTVFGDMDVSIIKDKPPGRIPVKTHLAKESNEAKVYEFIRKELEMGKQVYFVYPLIEGTDDIKDAVSMAQRLEKEIFPKYKVALIHSKLAEDVKKNVMDDFRKGKINILAATSVVEVGVDVPNATCMVIEHAERFGLSALHQLRGRVGRGKDQSYCFLVYSDVLTEEGKTRLKVMLENNDGFIIAEEDLKMRGPGHIAGVEQSGYLVLGIANPIRDIEELQRARKDAFSILETDPDLLLSNHRIITRVLEEAPPFSETFF